MQADWTLPVPHPPCSPRRKPAAEPKVGDKRKASGQKAAGSSRAASPPVSLVDSSDDEEEEAKKEKYREAQQILEDKCVGGGARSLYTGLVPGPRRSARSPAR